MMVVSDAVPDTTGTVPTRFTPSKNATLPVTVAGVTVAVIMTGAPNPELAGETANAMDVAVAGLLVKDQVPEMAVPSTVPVAVYEPEMELAVAFTLAMPNASVTAELPERPAPGPLDGALKLTVTPDNALPLPSFTTA